MTKGERRDVKEKRKQKPHDPKAPYDGYDERDDTEEKARNIRLEKVISVSDRIIMNNMKA